MDLSPDDRQLFRILCMRNGSPVGEVVWDAPLWRLINSGLVHIDWSKGRALILVSDDGWELWQTRSAAVTEKEKTLSVSVLFLDRVRSRVVRYLTRSRGHRESTSFDVIQRERTRSRRCIKPVNSR